MKLGMLMLMVLMGIHYAGTWVDTTFTTPSLGFPNQVRIYLPDGYDPQGSVDYPTIYWLHGWMLGGGPGHTASHIKHKTALDSLISSGQIEPVIVIKPNGSCDPYEGSNWANSMLNGNYEDYVV
jgi:endo-1,4-beta-xylanase